MDTYLYIALNLCMHVCVCNIMYPLYIPSFLKVQCQEGQKKNGNHTLHTFIRNRQKWPKLGHFKLINGSSCIEKHLGKLHSLYSSVQAQFNT